MTKVLGAEEHQKILLKRLRKIVFFAVLSGIAFFFWKYDIETIPADYDHLEPQHMPAGSTVVMTDFDAETPFGIGSVLLYRAPGFEDQHCYGVVAGMPGEMAILLEPRAGEGRLDVAGRKEIFELPANHKLNSGIIPEGFLLLLNGDRNLRAGKTSPDSRIFGLIPMANVVARVLTALNPFRQ